MHKPKIYIDGQAGTTGLEIVKRLQTRDDIELLLIPDELRHDNQARSVYMNEADLVFLCLPDQASKDAMSLIGSNTKVIDASTAHRTNPEWTYGFPELSLNQKEEICNTRFLANPGCHATGFISIVYPLVKMGFLNPDSTISCTSLTGYSGGGKKMIHQYEQEKSKEMNSPAIYATSLTHKHLREMKYICGLQKNPLFSPIVDDYYRGMLTSVMIEANAKEVHKRLENFYEDGLVHVHPFGYEGNIYANTFENRDDLLIIVDGNEEQTLITAMFDNLGKGACGAAIQNMNLMLGLDEKIGLRI